MRHYHKLENGSLLVTRFIASVNPPDHDVDKWHVTMADGTYHLATERECRALMELIAQSSG